MKQNLEVFILKDEEKNFKAHHIPVDKFNENYHKYVSGEHNVYFIIPVSNISNIYMILDRNSMPKIFKPMQVNYTLEVLSLNFLTSELEPMYTQNMTTDIRVPHDIFTFIYNLSELTMFNTLFNDTRNDTGTFNDALVYNIYDYEIRDSEGVKKDQILGIPSLILALETQYKMTLSTLNSIECILNGDGSCAYSDPLNLNTNSLPKLIGNTKFDGTRAFSMTLPHNQVPVHTFLSNEDTQMIEDVNEYFYRGDGVVTYFMGTPLVFKTTDRFSDSMGRYMCYKERDDGFTLFTNINDDNFSVYKSSTTHIDTLIDYVIYLKMTPSILRAANMLVHLNVQDKFTMEPKFDNILPCFRYEFNVIECDGTTNEMKWRTTKYVKDYIIDRDDFLDTFDPYKDFIKDIEDAWIPF